MSQLIPAGPRATPGGFRFDVGSIPGAYANAFRTHRGYLTSNLAQGRSRNVSRVTGAPTISGMYAHFTGARDFVDVDFTESASCSVFIAARLPGAGSGGASKGILLSARGPSLADPSREAGLVVRQDSETTIRAYANWTKGDGTQDLYIRDAPYTPGAWMLLEVKVGPTYLALFNHTLGGGASRNDIVGTREVSGARLRAGSGSVGSVYAGDVDIAFVYAAPAQFAATLSGTMVADLKAKKMAPVGIEV
ncbi:hypothetical protein ACFQ4O_01720 [Methylopila musalis]|uniref:LamG domain-containing protein n=1 Tax=Methylopila musalis TaxID=1134781 RepID=A0ABW3Z393_9HYPH